MQLLSLFCGAGGLDLGFYESGFDLRLAIDWSEAAIDTHSYNFPKSKAVREDLLALGVDGLLTLCKHHIKPNGPLGIIGGPPCQGFSRGNPNSQPNDPRNQLAIFYVDFITAISNEFDVKFVVFENVMGLKDKKHLPTYQKITTSLNNTGFDVYENELNAINFGVAQERKRIIIVAIKKGITKQKFLINPIDKKAKKKTVRDVISGLPEPVYFNKKIRISDIVPHPNHWTMTPKSNKFKNPALLVNKTRSFRVIDWDKPSPTIAYGNREIYVHPEKKRRLSIFESLLLQGFPEDFVLKGTLSQQVTQVSNAVPPPMAKQVALSIKKTLRG